MIRIGKTFVGEKKPVYIIAEAGINHNGDLAVAKKMIKTVAKIGVNAIKFQTILPDELFSKTINPELYEMLKKWILNIKDHQSLKKYAEKNGIEFLSTPMGVKTLELLKKIKVRAIKIASGDLNNIRLLEESSKIGVPLIVSTGMSTLSEIVTSVKCIRKHNQDFVLLHCNSSYPTPLEDVNLKTIPFLKERFNVPVGYSDHTLGIEACLGAVSMGACMIEKHFTLDKNMEGPDQKLSADPNELSQLVKKIRLIEKCIGKPRTGVTKSEKKFRKLMRKSVGVVRDLKKGTKIREGDLELFRPAIGISPEMRDNVIGMILQKDIKKGMILQWKYFKK